MDKSILILDKGTRCTAWNYSGQRLVAGLDDGTVIIYDSTDPASSTFISSTKFKVSEVAFSLSLVTLYVLFLKVWCIVFLHYEFS